MNYDITIEYKDGRVCMIFLGVDFFALDKVLGALPIKRLYNYCFGIFNPEQEEPTYIQSSDNNISEIISVPITNLHSLIEFFSSIPDREDFSIYKLKIDFNDFSMFYDDDCMLAVEGKCSDNAEFQFFKRRLSAIFWLCSYTMPYLDITLFSTVRVEKDLHGGSIFSYLTVSIQSDY